MLFRDVMYLRKSIEESRQEMYDLIREKGFNDPGVIKISQRLDDKMSEFHKILSELKGSQPKSIGTTGLQKSPILN